MCGCTDVPPRYAIGRLLALTAFATVTCLPAGAVSAPTEDATVTIIFRDAEWYRARPEKEQTWRGRLVERNVPVGPGGRSSLSFELKTDNGVFPVYEDGAKSRIASLVGFPVELSGKLVDLSSEGFGTELWIATGKRLTSK
jgi:hypothetical protein